MGVDGGKYEVITVKLQVEARLAVCRHFLGSPGPVILLIQTWGWMGEVGEQVDVGRLKNSEFKYLTSATVTCS